ncbi:MAG TPA: alpha/beta hydrolase [Polyangiaceae bacterium]
MANKSRCQVVSIDYRLAPEHPFPTPVDDSLAAFRHIRDNAALFEADPARLAVGGDSAGGNISAVICQICKQTGEPMPAFQMLIYPATDARRQSESRDLFAEGYFLTQDLMEWFWTAYAPADADLTDVRLSPVLAEDVSGLPPAFVLTAGFDPLRDEGRAYAEKMAAAGVAVEHVCAEGMPHGFLTLGGALSEAARIVHLVADRVRAGVSKRDVASAA